MLGAPDWERLFYLLSPSRVELTGAGFRMGFSGTKLSLLLLF